MKQSKTPYSVAVLALAVLFCGCEKKINPKVAPREDIEAKAMLAGIWIDADEETVIFKIKGDTVYYPDSTSRPVKFQIVGDTMVMYGNNVSKYPIIRQTPHIFEFKNQNNETIKLVKSENPSDSLQFVRRNIMPLNQGKVVKCDTVVMFSDKRYHSYVQVNPTTYKVYRQFYNTEGIEVENIYYDNIVHVSVFMGRNKIFSKDFTKNDFAAAVPQNMLKQSILSDIRLVSVSDAGLHYRTQLTIPDSPSSFLVELVVSFSGDTSVRVLS